jgi:F-type H+-transporting ATPase subunit b
MPQINQLSVIFFSQLFWLLVVFGIIYFVIGRMMVPKIQATVDLREQRIAADLEAAQVARSAADETEAAWRGRMDAARVEAARISNEAKQKSAANTEVKVRAAVDQINLKIESAEAKIRKALVSARSEIEAVSAEATRDMVARLTGLKIDSKAAAEAVKAELNVPGAN